MLKRAILVLLAILTVAVALLLRSSGGDARGPASTPRPGAEHSAVPPVREPAPLVAPSEVTAPPPLPPADELDPAVAHTGAGRTDTAKTRIELRVVDARTGEAVPDVAVSLNSAGLSVHLRTDAAGRANGVAELPRGPIRAAMFDAGEPVGALERDFAGGDALAWTLPVEIGPTYPIALDPRVEPEAATDADPGPGGDHGAGPALFARLIESTRGPGTAGEIVVVGDDLLVAPDGGGLADREWSWREARAGDPLWIRYPTIEHEPTGVHRVSLVARRGGRQGRADVAATVGIQPPVRVALDEPVGALLGLVEDDRGRPIGAATVLLLPVSAPGVDETPIWERARTGADGMYSFSGLEPGTRKLVVLAKDCAIEARLLQVRAGVDRAVVRLRRAAAQPSYWLAGPRNPEALGDGQLILRGQPEEAWPFARRFVETDGYTPAGMTCFSPSDVPTGRFVASHLAWDRAPGLRPYAFVFDSGETSAFEPIPEEGVPHRFVVTDARDGAELECKALFGPEGAVYLSYYLKRGPSATATALPLPFDAPLRWAVTARGRAPAFGDESAFQDEDGARVARVALTPGWGAELFFRAGDPTTFASDPGPWKHWTFPAASYLVGLFGAPPLPNVEVLADGETPRGKSDADGALRLSLPAVPKRLTLRCSGWRLVAVERTVFALDDRFVVWLAREPH